MLATLPPVHSRSMLWRSSAHHWCLQREAPRAVRTGVLEELSRSAELNVKMFVYPACSAATPAQKIFKIKLQYLAQVLCSKTGKGVLKDKIINALQGLNEEWRFSACDKISQEECKDFNVDINCVKKASNKVKRQANEVDQKYDLEISFPTLDGEDAININDGRRKKIERLLQEIIIDENNLSVDNILPGTLLNPASVDITQSFSCPLGSVVIDSTCVPCPHGTFYDETSDTCVSCPVGSYNSEEAQVQCNICPEINGVAGTTEKEGSIKLSDCKETCPAGQFFDKIVGLCRPCGNGKYQPDEGKFFCYMCGVGLTTRTTEALTRDECRPECEDGHQIDLQGNCIPCLLGQYRQKGVDLGCKQCPKGFTTSKSGASSASDCSLPICLAGHYLDALTNECTMCQPGFYQPDDQQTECLPCPQDTTTKREGATSKDECTNRCKVAEGEQELCDRISTKAATLGVKPNHLLCISVEEVGGSTTTTPPFHHHHSTFTPPSLHPPHFLHLPSPWIVITSYNLKEDFATDKRLKDINSL